MKQLRLTAIAAILAISAVAVSRANMQSDRAPQTWFLIQGGDPDVAADYSSTDQGFTCDGQSIICTIEAEDANGQPDLSQGPVTQNPEQYSATFRE